jgi:hypothetical protein
MSDKTYSIVASIFVLSVAVLHHYLPGSLEFLSTLTRPGATLLMLGIVGFVYKKGFHMTALVLMIGAVLLLKTVWHKWLGTAQRDLYLDIGKDLSRFEPENSIDLQFANKTVTHDQPHFLEPMQKVDDILIFPPSDETLRQLSG